jgi:ribosomal protein L14E/L6E/L27E
MATAASPTGGEKKKEDDRKKLTKVLSTKLSIEDYNRFEKYTNYAFQAGIIEEPETSKLLRYIVTYPFNELGL